jgi:hypothetical protein
MNRPLYETKQDLLNEQAVASALEAAWNCNLRKLPIKYQLDFVAERRSRAVAFCEIKCRTKTMEDMKFDDGYIFSLDKFIAAKSLCQATGLPFILIVRAIDKIWYAKLMPEELNQTKSYFLVRKDRNDWQDGEPFAWIGLEKLKIFGETSAYCET